MKAMTESLGSGAAGRLLLAVIRLTRQTRQASPSGLTPSQVSALAMLAQSQPVRISDLAAAEGVALPVMTRLVVSLEELGLVDKATSQTDRRSVLVQLTSVGFQKLRDIYSARAGQIADRMNRLSEAELETLQAALPVLEKLVAQGSESGRS